MRAKTSDNTAFRMRDTSTEGSLRLPEIDARSLVAASRLQPPLLLLLLKLEVSGFSWGAGVSEVGTYKDHSFWLDIRYKIYFDIGIRVFDQPSALRLAAYCSNT